MYAWWRQLNHGINTYKHQHNITNPNYTPPHKNYVVFPNHRETKNKTLIAPVFLNNKEYIELPKSTINKFIWINIINPLMTGLTDKRIRNVTYIGY